MATSRQAPLAAREGIAPSKVWLPQGPWSTVGAFLIERFPHVAEADLRWRLERGDIVNEQGQTMAFDTPYTPQSQQWLWYYREVPNEVPVPFDMPILYADEALIAVDKPHFLATTPGGQYLKHTALTRLRQYFSEMDISPLHRLDRETAGVLLFCRQPELRGAYQTLFQQQAVEREYEAVAPLSPTLSFPLEHRSHLTQPKQALFVEEIDDVEPNSHTHIELLRITATGYGHYKLTPYTGRKHQLRVHMSALGMPILNDSYYPQRPATPQPDDYNKPLQLLARCLAFTDPITGSYRSFISSSSLIMA